jgi:serine/threonine protein kinase
VLSTGRTIGSYRIVSKIGTGGMGAVYLAEHPVLLGKRVALKIIHHDLISNGEIVARFIQEAQAVNRIGHDNIVEIHDFGVTDDGDQFYIMEYLEGRTLATLMASEPLLEVARAKRIAAQLAAALAAAHAAGVIHRDLKPDNIMLIARRGDADFVKVLDFGLAKLFASESMVQTAAGVLLGTPQYMSPEACEGRRAVDHRTDIYAVGVLLYQMVTAQLPFDGDSMGDVLIKQMSLPPPAPRAANPSLPASLEQIILRCLAKQPELRYQSMNELRDALIEPDEERTAITAVPSASPALVAAAVARAGADAVPTGDITADHRPVPRPSPPRLNPDETTPTPTRTPTDGIGDDTAPRVSIRNIRAADSDPAMTATPTSVLTAVVPDARETLEQEPEDLVESAVTLDNTRSPLAATATTLELDRPEPPTIALTRGQLLGTDSSRASIDPPQRAALPRGPAKPDLKPDLSIATVAAVAAASHNTTPQRGPAARATRAARKPRSQWPLVLGVGLVLGIGAGVIALIAFGEHRDSDTVAAAAVSDAAPAHAFDAAPVAVVDAAVLTQRDVAEAVLADIAGSGSAGSAGSNGRSAGSAASDLSSSAQLELTSTPPGAMVVDAGGTSLGTTPLVVTWPLSDVPASFRFELFGYQPKSAETVVAGPTSLHVDLDRDHRHRPHPRPHHGGSAATAGSAAANP